jgi:putative ABC transport system permease protein
MTLQIFQGSIEQGLLWAVMTLGVFITFRILDYADLTVDGSFTLGAAVCATLISKGYSPILSIIIAFIAGNMAGFVTGLLHTKLGIAPLLSGILSMIALYSINLRIMGKANVSLLGEDTIYTIFSNKFGLTGYEVLIIGAILAIFIISILWIFFKTEIGFAIRATGNNEQMIRSQGVNTHTTKIIGLAISNGLVALSGAFVAQYLTFADMSMGIGTIVIGLASVIIGEVIVGNQSILRSLIAVVIGSIVYRIIIAVVLQLGLPATDLKMFSAFIVIIALALPTIKNNIHSLKKKRARGEFNVNHQ